MISNSLKQFIVLMLISVFFCNAEAKNNEPIYGIIDPMTEESQYLQKLVSNKQTVNIDGIRYVVGKLGNKNIVMTQSGIGKVDATIVTTRLIRDFHPILIVMSGSSGNINPMLKKNDVVIGKELIDADFGELTSHGVKFKYAEHLLSPQTKTPHPLQFNLDKHLTEVIEQANKDHPIKVKFGKIATSDVLPNNLPQIKLLKASGVDVVEMEGSAFMQTCRMFNTLCVVIRGVSNNAKEPITIEDIKQSADYAAKIGVALIEHFD